jgi:DNA modification methylase
MAEGGHKEEYTYPDNEDDMEWWAECRWNIKDVRSLYSSIDYYIKIWPGEPERPKDEKKFLTGFKENLFRMITDYNYTHHFIEEPKEDDT